MPHLLDRKNRELLTSHGVFSEAELASRCEIMLENYCKTICIEARTMVTMARTQIAPAVESFAAATAANAACKKTLCGTLKCRYETELVETLSALTDEIAARTAALETEISALSGGVAEEAARIRDAVLPAMEALRGVCDEAERKTAKANWPFPTYAELLFGV